MKPDSSSALPETPVETPAADYSNPNDLDYEMSEEQEQSFVNQILGDGDYRPPVGDKPIEVETPVVEEVTETPTAPVVEAPVETEVEAPTETAAPQSDDLWIEVERVVEDELGEQKTETIKLIYDPNDPDSFIPEDFTAKSTKQLADIMEAKAEMKDVFKGRQAEYEKAEASKNTAAQEKQVLDTWNSEIQDLVDAGAIPDAKEHKDEFDAKTDAVFKFMAEENVKRLEVGKPVIASFGTAYTLFENNEAKIAAEAAEKQEIEDTKKKGAMIGGSSAASGGSPEPSAYQSGSHKNIWEVPVGE